MSRTFSKILIICAMAVIFPLLIVGTSLAAYYSISAIVEVDTYVNYTNVHADSNAFAGVLYNNKNEKAFTIEESHMKDLSLKATTNGYVFEGWFNGNQTAYSTLLASGTTPTYISTAAELTVDITEYEELLAVYSVKEFNVTYTYKAQPNDVQDVVETKHYYFGDALLPELSYTGPEYKFKGWQIAGNAQAYTIANFATDKVLTDISITGVWEKQTEIDVNYFAEDKTTLLKTTKIYQNQDFTLELVDDILAQTSNTKLDGYKYYWIDDNNQIISDINRKSSINVYVAKEVVVYDATLTSKDGIFKGDTSVKFTVNNADSLKTWLDTAKWQTAFSFHKFAGLVYDGVTYATEADIANLQTAIVTKFTNGTEDTIEVEAIFNKFFTKIDIENDITFKAKSNAGAYNQSIYTEADLNSVVKYAYELPAYEIDSSETIYGLLNMSMNDGSTLKLYTVDGKLVQLKSLTIKINGKTNTISVAGSEPLNQLIEKILNHPAWSGIADANTLTITSIQANFDLVA
ncbi:MAG: hypothetical protein J6J24_05275 [Clostridia bacterium]|nr:hypothetical protein [Clostridia bacterium]